LPVNQLVSYWNGGFTAGRDYASDPGVEMPTEALGMDVSGFK
jgi:hypothetical protein